MLRIHPAPGGAQPSDMRADLSQTRDYLRRLSEVCREGASSNDPRVTLLALGVVARAATELL